MRSWGWSPHDRISAPQFSSVAQSCPTLQPHESQHARSPCPSPTPEVYSNSCPLSWWCHPAISSSVVPFSSCPQSLPESGSFPVSQLFAWGGQSTGVSALASVLPMNTYSALTRNERNTRASSLSLSLSLSPPYEHTVRQVGMSATPEVGQELNLLALWSDFPASRTVRIKSLLLKPPSLWHFVMRWLMQYC